jgi:hypothetical protein
MEHEPLAAPNKWLNEGEVFRGARRINQLKSGPTREGGGMQREEKKAPTSPSSVVKQVPSVRCWENATNCYQFENQRRLLLAV